MAARKKTHSKASRSRQDIADLDICFIGGTMKSGTTWVQLLLDAHPEIRCRGEGHIVDVLVKELAGALTKYNNTIQGKNSTIFKEIEGFPILTQDDFTQICRTSAMRLFAKFDYGEGVRVLAEKTPDNVSHFEMLKQLFPRSKFINVIRDGRDVAVSGWHHNQRNSPKWAAETFGTIEKYCQTMAGIWLQQIASAQKFSEANPGAVTNVKYEDLLNTPAAEMKRIFKFLEVESSAELIKECREAASFKTLSGGRDPGQEDRSSHFRKGVAEQWRDDLSAEGRRIFNSIAGAQLKQLGYEVS
jgi:hypothetical protein